MSHLKQMMQRKCAVMSSGKQISRKDKVMLQLQRKGTVMASNTQLMQEIVPCCHAEKG
jgi:hypothetical protein